MWHFSLSFSIHFVQKVTNRKNPHFKSTVNHENKESEPLLMFLFVPNNRKKKCCVLTWTSENGFIAKTRPANRKFFSSFVPRVGKVFVFRVTKKLCRAIEYNVTVFHETLKAKNWINCMKENPIETQLCTIKSQRARRWYEGEKKKCIDDHNSLYKTRRDALMNYNCIIHTRHALRRTIV